MLSAHESTLITINTIYSKINYICIWGSKIRELPIKNEQEISDITSDDQ